MFYNIALRTGIALNFIAIISNMLICFINDESRWNGQMCIFRKNCASVPEERSAIPLQTEQSSAG